MNSDDLNPDKSNVDAEIGALKSQVFILLVALVVISGTLMVYLYREASLLSKQRQQMDTVVTQTKNAMGNFVGNLVVYGSKHPEFVPLLKKYGLAPTVGMPGVSTAPKK